MSKIFFVDKLRAGKQKTFQMTTTLYRLGFLSLLAMLIIGFSACNTEDVANANITVLQKQPVATGLLPIAVEGASVRIYAPEPSEVEINLITDQNGKASFEYEFDAILLVDAEYDGAMSTRNGLVLEVGESAQITIVLPE